MGERVGGRARLIYELCPENRCRQIMSGNWFALAKMWRRMIVPMICNSLNATWEAACEAEAIEALAARDADLDLDHVEPAGVLWGVVERQAAAHAPGFVWVEGAVAGGGRRGRRRD